VTSRLAVIIPALNEGPAVAATVLNVRRLLPHADVLLVDGGSVDATCRAAAEAGATVLPAPRGRGSQCGVGANATDAEWMLFLHADTVLPVNTAGVVEAFIRDRDARIATFRLRFDRGGWLLRASAWFTRFDTVFTRFGDQGILVRRDFYRALGGFPEWPLFEDVELLRRARRLTRIVSLPDCVTTSARRFERHGAWRQQGLNARLLLRFLAGTSPFVLAQRYDQARSQPAKAGSLSVIIRSLALFCALLFGVHCSTRAAETLDHRLLTQILGERVKDGKVDYAGLKSDARLDRYLLQLAATDPEKLPNDSARLAFWLNAYNAYTLKLIVDRQPVKSITEIGAGGLVVGSVLKTTAWDIRFAEVGGKRLTLNEIEHEIIRRKFKDARAHFALVCASGSCPVLSTEAYDGDKLDAQLDGQAELFLRDSTRNRFDLATKTAYLSSIFSWYQGDFGPDKIAALRKAASYAAPDVRAAIEAEPAAWKVEYLTYDWSLNAQRN
jgi:rSAM/selenodomain-associated transferase 2